MRELGKWIRGLFNPIAKAVAVTGISPNTVTAVGALLSLAAMWTISAGRMLLGGIFVLIVDVMDGLDGAVARVTRRETRLGAFLDSTLDRVSEVTIYLGLLVFYSHQGSSQGIYLTYFVIINSFLTSYIRARAESQGFECNTGFLNRPLRLLVLAIGLMFDQVTNTLWLLAIFSGMTAMQRLIYVLKQANK